MKRQTVIFTLTSLLLLTGFQNCAPNADAPEDGGPQQALGEVNAEKSVGTWKQSCKDLTAGSVLKSSMQTSVVVAANGDFRLEMVRHNNESCSSPLVSVIFAGAVAEKPGDVLVGRIDRYLLAFSADFIETLNATKFCGLENWQAHIAKDISRATCVTVTHIVSLPTGGTSSMTIHAEGYASTISQLPLAIDRMPFRLEGDKFYLDGMNINGSPLTEPFHRQ